MSDRVLVQRGVDISPRVNARRHLLLDEGGVKVARRERDQSNRLHDLRWPSDTNFSVGPFLSPSHYPSS